MTVKAIKNLELRIHLSECLHLALMTLCVAFPIALLFKEDDPLVRVLWALGTVIPVQLIRFVCERIKKRLIMLPIVLGIIGLSILITHKDYHYVYYAAACLPIAFSGLVLPRPKGKLIFTIPNLVSLFVPVLVYAIGQVTSTPLLSRLAIAIEALLTLNYFLHLNQFRLLTDIRMSTNTEVSASGMIRQNRKVVTIFLIVGVLLIAAIPLLLRSAPPETTEVVEEYAPAATPEPTKAPIVPRDYMKSPNSKPLNLDFLPLLIGFALSSAVIIVIVGAVYLFIMLFSHLEKKRKHELPDIEDSMTFERLKPEVKERERITGYDKKIRRRYEKLIRSRAREESRPKLPHMTPTELENAAEVTGIGGETIHEIYSKTRYSREPATRESYLAFKDAVRSLPDPKQEKPTEAKTAPQANGGSAS